MRLRILPAIDNDWCGVWGQNLCRLGRFSLVQAPWMMINAVRDLAEMMAPAHLRLQAPRLYHAF